MAANASSRAAAGAAITSTRRRSERTGAAWANQCWGWKNEAIHAGPLKLECVSLINKKHQPQTQPTPALTSPSLLQVL